MKDKIKEAIEQMTELNSTELCEELIRKEEVKSPDFAEAALAAGIFHPDILYQDASPEVRDRLIAMLEQDQMENANGCLTALAMIGDDVVAKYFQKWEENPRPWRKYLCCGPLLYALNAGWYLEDGKKKLLYFNTCYALEKADQCVPEENVFGGTSTGQCPNCGSTYVNNLIIDGNDKRLSSLGLHGRIKIKYCAACVYEFEFNYCKYEEDGESTFIRRELNKGTPWESTGEPDDMLTVDDEDLNDHECFVLSKKPVSPNYCNEFERSAIGGRPAFVNDANYADCPECGKRMKHIAQLGEEYTGGGTHYIQICTHCKIAAITYQQT